MARTKRPICTGVVSVYPADGERLETVLGRVLVLIVESPEGQRQAALEAAKRPEAAPEVKAA